MSRTTPRSRYRIPAIAATAALALGALACGAGAAAADPAPAAPSSGSTTSSPSADAAAPAQVPSSFTKTSQGGSGTVDLTIDDGPDPDFTPQVLKVLHDNGVHATFCMIGNNAQQHPGLVKKVARAGNRLCDHSVNHDMTMDQKTVPYQEREILGAEKTIDTAAGGVAKAQYYRAPGGAFTPASRAFAASQGLRPLGWDIDPKDWSTPGTQQIVSAVKEQFNNGKGNGPIILFHDGGGNRSETVAALKQLIPWFKAQGYGFSFPSTTAP
ncbi:polysaccharide deacetylase family protein [Streptomyces sp. IBSNAI002]|uniref:polysaccharide deacetylase family protein n=1 Tax=Streptomyces sp. IBSNAI002 TaxID=3457500 RepID=UPI003FD27586